MYRVCVFVQQLKIGKIAIGTIIHVQASPMSMVIKKFNRSESDQKIMQVGVDVT